MTLAISNGLLQHHKSLPKRSSLRVHCLIFCSYSDGESSLLSISKTVWAHKELCWLRTTSSYWAPEVLRWFFSCGRTVYVPLRTLGLTRFFKTVLGTLIKTFFFTWASYGVDLLLKTKRTALIHSRSPGKQHIACCTCVKSLHGSRSEGGSNYYRGLPWSQMAAFPLSLNVAMLLIGSLFFAYFTDVVFKITFLSNCYT